MLRLRPGCSITRGKYTMKYHIEDLRDQLHNHNWIVLKESEGNDLDISE